MTDQPQAFVGLFLPLQRQAALIGSARPSHRKHGRTYTGIPQGALWLLAAQRIVSLSAADMLSLIYVYKDL